MGSFVWELSIGSFCLESCARSGSRVGEPALGNVSLGSLAWEFRLETVAKDLVLGDLTTCSLHFHSNRKTNHAHIDSVGKWNKPKGKFSSKAVQHCFYAGHEGQCFSFSASATCTWDLSLERSLNCELSLGVLLLGTFAYCLLPVN